MFKGDFTMFKYIPCLSLFATSCVRIKADNSLTSPLKTHLCKGYDSSSSAIFSFCTGDNISTTLKEKNKRKQKPLNIYVTVNIMTNFILYPNIILYVTTISETNIIFLFERNIITNTY